MVATGSFGRSLTARSRQETLRPLRKFARQPARSWPQIAQGPERDIDAITTREAGFDPDLWVIEIESRDGRTLLDQDGLA